MLFWSQWTWRLYLIKQSFLMLFQMNLECNSNDGLWQWFTWDFIETSIRFGTSMASSSKEHNGTFEGSKPFQQSRKASLPHRLNSSKVNSNPSTPATLAQLMPIISCTELPVQHSNVHMSLNALNIRVRMHSMYVNEYLEKGRESLKMSYSCWYDNETSRALFFKR